MKTLPLGLHCPWTWLVVANYQTPLIRGRVALISASVVLWHAEGHLYERSWFERWTKVTRLRPPQSPGAARYFLE